MCAYFQLPCPGGSDAHMHCGGENLVRYALSRCETKPLIGHGLLICDALAADAIECHLMHDTTKQRAYVSAF